MEIILVKVKPSQPKTRITKEENNILYIDIKSKPENNEANIELIRFFRRELKKDVKIVKGLTNKNKVLKVIFYYNR